MRITEGYPAFSIIIHAPICAIKVSEYKLYRIEQKESKLISNHRTFKFYLVREIIYKEKLEQNYNCHRIFKFINPLNSPKLVTSKSCYSNAVSMHHRQQNEWYPPKVSDYQKNCSTL